MCKLASPYLFHTATVESTALSRKCHDMGASQPKFLCDVRTLLRPMVFQASVCRRRGGLRAPDSAATAAASDGVAAAAAAGHLRLLVRRDPSRGVCKTACASLLGCLAHHEQSDSLQLVYISIVCRPMASELQRSKRVTLNTTGNFLPPL